MASSGQNVQTQPLFQTRSPTAVRRPSPAPRNDRNEIFCTHDECLGKNITFRRLCEWNKHMDRHERPYKCQHPNCQNAQGFTYSGGLMRHQREVHRWHQTTKSRLFCPFPDCVRSSSGEGFSRRENLEEHKRRRHPDTEPPDTDNPRDHQQGTKRKRLATPLPSESSAKADTPEVDAEDDGHGSAIEASDTEEVHVVKKLKSQLAHARDEIQRLVTENDGLRDQVSRYYTFLQQTPLQVYPLNHSAGGAQGFMPHQNSYLGTNAMTYNAMHDAYKK